jgi:hypothetical protein
MKKFCKLSSNITVVREIIELILRVSGASLLACPLREKFLNFYFNALALSCAARMLDGGVE